MIAWFARNGVAANLLLMGIALAGVATIVNDRLAVEVFPTFETNHIHIRVPYRGATPEEAERTVVIPIEEAVANVSGVKQITSSASSGIGSVTVELKESHDRRAVMDEIKTQVDALPAFPAATEPPVISFADTWRHVISIVIYGDLEEGDMRRLGEKVRDDIIAAVDVGEAQLQGVRPYEIGVEISEATLQRYGLSFDQVARALREASIDVSAGTLKAPSGEVALRTRGQAYTQEEWENIVILSRPDGSRITLGQVAHVSDGFDENLFVARFNGRRCILIAISREEEQNAIQISKDIKAFMEHYQHQLPPGVEFGYWSDMARIVEGRLNTLVDSFLKSILLVFIVLTLFLRPSLAIWVAIGIPLTFLGCLSLLPLFGVTINVISLFGFILVLGIVVDDAIVTGENIYTHQQRGSDLITASIEGTKEVTRPVVFGVLTTILAFIPLLFGSGFQGRANSHIAFVVIPVLLFSLVESKLILPSHLTHNLRDLLDRLAAPFTPAAFRRGVARVYESTFGRFQQFFAKGLEGFAHRVYRPLLHRALDHRYLTLALFLGAGILLAGFYYSGRIARIKFPRVASERAACRLTMQEGTPFEVTERQVMRIESIVRQMQAEYVDENGNSLIEDIMTSIGAQGLSSTRRSGSTGVSHQGEVVFYIVEPENRSFEIDTRQLVSRWREAIGPIIGAKELSFRAEIGRGGDPIDIQLTAKGIDSLKPLVEEIREHLLSYEGLFDISDTLETTREEVQLNIKPEAEQFGLTLSGLAQQVRQAFYGEEVQRINRDRDDVRVMLRYPQAERRSLDALEQMYIRTPDGKEIPFSSVAEIEIGESFPRINRVERNRAVNIRADADKAKVDIPNVRASISAFLQERIQEYPDVRYTFEGEAKEERENARTLLIGTLVLVFGIYAMLAIPFRSYIQPLIVMSVIPFGIIGAVLGHVFEGWRRMGFASWWELGPMGWLNLEGAVPLSLLSTFGILALAGVVVNDSLVLVDYINRRRTAGDSLLDAVRAAGVARFRAIILTSFTTFAGLIPLLTLKSTQAQFLVPMAISLGYGILFATAITLFLVPVNFLILEDIKRLYARDPEPTDSGMDEARAKVDGPSGDQPAPPPAADSTKPAPA